MQSQINQNASDHVQYNFSFCSVGELRSRELVYSAAATCTPCLQISCNEKHMLTSSPITHLAAAPSNVPKYSFSTHSATSYNREGLECSASSLLLSVCPVSNSHAITLIGHVQRQLLTHLCLCHAWTVGELLHCDATDDVTAANETLQISTPRNRGT